MQIQSVLTFISTLDSCESSQLGDVKLIKALKEYFKNKDPDALLQEMDVQCLLKCYEERWEQVADTDTSYIVSASVSNNLWIEFARELSKFINKKCYQIVLPTITNTRDFNNLSDLSETERFENFYVGIKGATLYRKRGLCDFLLTNNYYLETSRSLFKKGGYPVTIGELAQLRQQQGSGSFEIDDEQFVDFWNFLNRKVFPNLQSRAHQSDELLLDLNHLIRNYFSLKEAHCDFYLFKLQARKLFLKLKKSALEEVNYFYGMVFPYQQHHYLLDFLIDIYRAQDFTLDDELSFLTKHLEIESIKIEEAAYESGSSEHYVFSKQPILVHPSYLLILSLLTTSFQKFPITGGPISLWDKKNVVFSEAIEIYQALQPVFEEESQEALDRIYTQVIEHYISCDPSNWIMRITRYQSTSHWYQLVKEQKLSVIGIHWFEPVSLLEVLKDFKSSHLKVINRIQQFNDDLIKTYVQNERELLKRFRVNILFTVMMHEFLEVDKLTIRTLLKKATSNDSNSFISLCHDYIHSRLNHIIGKPLPNTCSFFNEKKDSPVRYKKEEKAVPEFISKPEFHQVHEIVNYYKELLLSKHFSIESPAIKFLQNLSQPILSIKEVQYADDCSGHQDFCAGPT